VAQPLDRSRLVPAPGQPSTELGEFWVPNPWLFPRQGKNLSSYERNRVFLNRGALRFLDISHLSGADSDGDGRSAVAADLNGDGMLDVAVRQAGGGSLLVFENRFPRQHYLEVTLRGTQSNRTGVGSRLVAQAGGRVQTRELYPADTFRSQAACLVHFGLGKASAVDRLTVYWPSGTVQEFRDLPADQHILLQESESSIETLAAQ
jgi:hypothetical protein